LLKIVFIILVMDSRIGISLRITQVEEYQLEFTKAESLNKELISPLLIRPMPQSSLKITSHLVLQKRDKIMRNRGHHLRATEKPHLLRKASLRKKIFSITEYKIFNSNSLVMMKKWC
jgi:hypothetical protein